LLLPNAEKSWLVTAVLLCLLAASFTLLGLASVELGYAGRRFRAVRVIEHHREQIAVLGLVLLAATGILFLFTWLRM
jgi:hypothetical protein